jgi:uncharacterized repeat protein (TIGR03803 family)
MVAAGSLLALLLASGARAGEVSATQGPLDLGTRVNGVAGGRCQGGQCEVSGGTAAGANLFHRFNRFDTRGEIRGVSIQNGPYRTVVLGVLDPLGSFLNKGISLSSPAHLFFLSPGGLHVGAGAQFFNTPRLTLSTASSLGLGSGRFDVFRTTAAEAALLTGMPIRGKGGLSGDPAEAQRNGLTSGGDLVVDGGLIQVDEELLLDAQGAHLLLQAGSQLAAPGGSVELSGRNVTVAAGALVTTSAQAPAAPVPAPGTTTAPATAPVVPAAAVVATTATTSPAAPALSAVAAAPAVPVALPSGAMTNSDANSDTPVVTTAAVNPGPTTAPAEALASTAAPATTAATTPATPVHTDAAANSASATSEAPALPVPAAVAAPLPQAKPPAPAQISAPGLDGGVIRISASSDAVVAGQLKALGVAATGSGTAASGTEASGGSGKGGRIEVTGQRVALTGAALDASGPAGGGTVLLGGDVRGANPAVPNASSTNVDAASTVRADALAKGDGGTVVAYASQRTEVAGLLSVRGGPDGGNGGFVETSGATVALSRGPDLAAPLGKGGTWLIDPVDITITSTIPDAITLKGSIEKGSNPYAELIPAGNNTSLYYGTTGYGGQDGKGALYEFNSATGSISLKASFTGPANTGSNGGLPRARLTGPVNGLYYGTAAQGGDNYSGVIYAFNPRTDTISVEASFIGCNPSNDCTGSNGNNPYSGLIADSHGLYYGTASEGGSSNHGAIYAFDPTTRTISLKASFDFDTTGAFPYAGLIAADDGKYYGTTRNGGDKDRGAIYAFDPTTNTISLKASFNGSNGANPGTLVSGGKDTYYGSTPYGGQFGKGAIYEFNSLTGTITLKDSFTGSNGAIAGSDLIAAGNGLFYGTTIEGGSNDKGAIYSFDSLSGKISLKASFTGSNGAKPHTALTAAGDGIFYGTTAFGGAFNRGTIFAFDANTYVSTATIESALNVGGNVVISTSDPLGPAGAGNITVNSPINKTAGGAASLTLNAHNNIVLNSNISSTSAALNLNLNADIDGNGSGATSLAPGASLSLNDGTVTANGPISIAANSKIKDTKIIAPTLSSDGGILDNVLLGNQDLSQPLVFSGAAYIDNGLRLASGASVTSTGSWLLRGDGEQAFSVSQTPFAITNTSNVGGSFYLWPKDYSFKQVFKAQETGYPVELAVNGGNNQNPMSFRLVISASDEEIFVKDYTGLTQRSSDWATSFPISGLTRPIKAGETVELSLTPSQSLGVEPLLIDNANWPRYPLPGYGDIALRFYVKLAELPASVNLAGGRIISDSGSVGQVLALNNGVDLKLNNTSTLDLDGLKLNGGSLQANGATTAKALDLIAGSISGSGDLQVTQSFNRSGGTIDGNFSNLSITQASGSLSPGALSAAGPVTLRAQNGQLNLNAPITASTVLARGSSGITLSGGASLTASAPSGRTITLDAGSGAFLNNYSAGAAALVKQPGATWAIYADNPTSTPPANLGGLPYNFKQYNQTFDTNQGSNPILGSGNGLFFANSPTISVNLTSQVTKTYDGTNTANLVSSNYNLTGVLSGDSVNINQPLSGIYDDKNATSGKLVSVSGLSITSATETATAVHVYGYILGKSTADASIGTITKAPLTISAATDSRRYNGSTSSSGVPTLTAGQVFSGDTLSGLSQMFDSKNVLGTNQSTLKVSGGYTLSDGNNGNNYAVSLSTASGTITQLDLPVTGLVANNKVYDATTVAPLGGSAAVSPLSGDVVTLSGTAVGAFSDKNVGVDKGVTVTGVTISGADSGNYNLLQQSGLKADIFKANLAVSGLDANNKVYDATIVAPLGGSAAVRPLSGDEVSVGGTAVGAFAEKNVGSGNAVTVSGVTIAGRDAANYNLLQQTGLAATISKMDLVVTGLFANNKVYDATTVAPLGGSAAVSPLSGDVVTLGGTAAAAFSDKNVGMDKAVTVSGVTIAGRDADNYTLLQQIGLKAIISKADLSLTGLLALDKVYDATTVAPLGGSAAVSPFSGDVVTLGGTAVGSFADKNVAQAKTVSVSGLSLSGNDAGNYNLLPLTNLKAAITPATLQISASSDSKIYDGSTQSSLAPKITQGSLWGDDRLTGLAQTYESKNALGAGQSKLIVSAYTLSDGNNGGNYVLSFLPGLGTINRASVTPSFTVKSKPYDGNVAAEIAGNSLQGGLASDEVFMVGASALFDNASAGNDKLVTITGYNLSGQDADNYQLSSPTATSTASITTSITTQQDTDSSLPNDEPIKNEQANPTVGLQLSTLSSATASKSVDVDISNVVLLPPGASAMESTPAGSTQSQPTPSATAVSATSSVPNQSQPTASATAVTADSATQEYQESDNRSAEDAKTSLGLSNAPTSEAMSPARLQLVMQSAASFIRKYPARMPNQ